MQPKLFAVYLGGTAPKANTELHDVVFVTGNTIEDTYEQLLGKWFGTPKGLHLDSWVELDIIEGHQISLQKEAASGNKKLFFINLGTYRNGFFGEIHKTAFLVAESEAEVKARSKAAITEKFDAPIHTDDLYELDECLQISDIDGYHIHLTPTDKEASFKPSNGYHIIPKPLIADYIARNS